MLCEETGMLYYTAGNFLPVFVLFHGFIAPIIALIIIVCYTGSVQLILAWSATEDELDYAPEPRIKPEARSSYEPHKGRRMEKLVVQLFRHPLPSNSIISIPAQCPQ